MLVRLAVSGRSNTGGVFFGQLVCHGLERVSNGIVGGAATEVSSVFSKALKQLADDKKARTGCCARI